jgi:exopolysaccharide biosynthesis polyprenyl glycosylphosphotransferase
MHLFGRKLVILLGDIALLYLSLLLTLVLDVAGVVDWEVFLQHAVPFSVLYLVWVFILYVMDAYELTLPPTSVPFMSRFGVAVLALFAVGVLFFYAITLTDLTPKTNLFIHVVLFGCLAYVWRLIFFAKISSLVPRRIGFLDLQEQEEELRGIVKSLKYHGYECVMLSSIGEDVSSRISDDSIDVVILPMDYLDSSAHIQTLYRCLGTGAVFIDVAQAYELFARRIPLSTINHQWFIRNAQDHEQGFTRMMKRLLDVCSALFILLFSLPIWMLVALAIKLEGGKVFYSQERVGKNREVFRIKKFRTMHSDAEASGAQWATKADPRVTRVGALLRRTHLDELPQMLNVLRGDISMVGPRPERPEFVQTLEQEIPHYHVRHFIKPGFTGWAQIKFRYARSVADSQRKFEYDLYYIKNRSLILDLLILLKTVQLLYKREK